MKIFIEIYEENPALSGVGLKLLVAVCLTFSSPVQGDHNWEEPKVQIDYKSRFNYFYLLVSCSIDFCPGFWTYYKFFLSYFYHKDKQDRFSKYAFLFRGAFFRKSFKSKRSTTQFNIENSLF